MYIERSLNHTHLSLILFSIALAFGVLLGIFIPTSLLTPFITIIADILFKIIIYFTLPYLFFSLLIASYELNTLGQFFTVLKHTARIGILLTIVVVGTSIIIFQLVPNQNIVSLINTPY